MNNLLKIKLAFKSEPNRSGGGARNLDKTRTAKSSSISHLIENLLCIEVFLLKKFFSKKLLTLDNIGFNILLLEKVG